MRSVREEVDCDGCAAGCRCWPEGTAPAAGFMVRRMRPLAPGEFLFRAGTPFEAPFLVTSGCVSLVQALDDGRERIVAFHVPGELVGLESLDQRLHRYSAQAINATTACRLRWSNAPDATRSAALLRALLAKATSQAAHSALPWPSLSATERVRAFVEDFRSRTDQPLPMTRAQIGCYLGMAEETVVRAFKALASNR